MNENLQILIIDIKSKRLFGKLFQRIEQYLGGNRKESGTLGIHDVYGSHQPGLGIGSCHRKRISF